MRKRRIYLGLVILAVAGVVGVIVVGAFREREPSEPEYQGRKLSEWAKRLGSITIHGGGDPETAEAAVRHIGTNAVPYLVKWGCYEQPAWKRIFYDAVNWTMQHTSSNWRMIDKKRVRAENAFLYLSHLEFEEFYGDTESQILIEASKPGLNGLKRALLLTLQSLSAIDHHGSPFPCVSTEAIPSLLVCLKSADPEIRVAASNLVRKAEFLLRSRDWDSWNYATNFLRKVDPQALERAKR